MHVFYWCIRRQGRTPNVLVGQPRLGDPWSDKMSGACLGRFGQYSLSVVHCLMSDRYFKAWGPRALVFRRPDTIYSAEDCHAHLFLEGSMSLTAQEIATRTCFSKAHSFTVSKILARISFLKARCHLRSGKFTRALVFRRLGVI